MLGLTKTDPTAEEWAINDEVVRLREWGKDRVWPLPEPPMNDCLIGSSDTCMLHLDDPLVSRRHARLVREQSKWSIKDLDSKNGLKLDGSGRSSFVLEPGSEIGIGHLTLIAESGRSIALRGFLTRVLGWTSDRTQVVDHALRSIRAAAARRGPLVLCGDFDLVPIAYALHRHALGGERPFVSCDPRRLAMPESVRSVENYPRGVQALEAAAGGSVCVWSSRLPRDFAQMRARLRDPATRVQLILLSRRDEPDDLDATVAAPVHFPSLETRLREVPRIVAEYAEDVLAELQVPRTAYSRFERDWILQHASSTLPEIETAMRRVIALRASNEFVSRAAERLGMSSVALTRWMRRRKLPSRPMP